MVIIKIRSNNVYYRGIEESVRKTGTEFGDGVGLWLRNINGDVHEITTTAEFTGFLSNTPISAVYRPQAYLASRTDTMPNWYITSENSNPKIIKSTEGQELSFVSDYTSERQWKRYSSDQYNPFTPEERLGWTTARDIGHAPLPLIPQPVEINLSQQQITVTNTWTIVIAETYLQFEAQQLAGKHC